MSAGLDAIPEPLRPKLYKAVEQSVRSYRFFCNFWLGFYPHPIQVEWANPTIHLGALCCGSGLGKSVGDASILLWEAFKNKGHSYGLFAPIDKQAHLVFEDCLNHITTGQNRFLVLVKQITRSPFPVIELHNGAQVIFLNTSYNAAHARGFDLNGAIWDECAFDKESSYAVLRTRVRLRPGWFRMSTTPKGMEWFYQVAMGIEAEMRSDLASKGKSNRFYRNATSWDNPHYPREILEDFERTMPRRQYRQEIMGEFVETEGATFRYEDLQRVFDPDWEPETEPRRDGLYVNAWDLGRKTSWTVQTTLAYDKQEGVEGDLRGIETRPFHSERWPTIFREIEEREAFWNRNGADCTSILDSTGVGDVVAQSVDVNAIPFIFTQKSRGELLLRLQKAVETPGKLRLPASWTRYFTQMQLHTAKEDAEGQTWDEIDSLGLAVTLAQSRTFSSPFAALG